MSFNKCFLNQEKLQNIYKQGKSERLRKYLNAYDAFMCSDDFSANMSREYYKLTDEEIDLLFESL